ncbi:uncharacterized protein V6R79_013544 [Siganus canaliculatus]
MKLHERQIFTDHQRRKLCSNKLQFMRFSSPFRVNSTKDSVPPPGQREPHTPEAVPCPRRCFRFVVFFFACLLCDEHSAASRSRKLKSSALKQQQRLVALQKKPVVPPRLPFLRL